MVSKRKHEPNPQVVKNKAQEVGQVEMRYLFMCRDDVVVVGILEDRCKFT